jgi:superfamily II DNA or RNA helicase
MTSVGACLRSGKRAVLLVSPTGSGKTCMGAMMAARFFLDRGKTIAWGAHRRELLDQAGATLASFGVMPGSLGGVKLGTYQEWTGRGEAPDADIFFADEAHHMGDRVGWRNIAKSYREAGKILIGLTATPGRGDGGALPDFDAIVTAAQIKELQDLGLLVPLIWRGPHATLASNRIARSPVDAYKEEAPGRCAVVFAQNTVAAASYLQEFLDAGIRAELITGDMHKGERARALARHCDGTTPVLVNVSVLTEGWDNPRCDCVIVARNCGSEALWIQMAGRGLRPFPGKLDCMLLDLHGVAHELGRPDAPATYSLEGKGIQLSDPAVQLERLCKVCMAPLGAEWVCVECGKDHTPPKPKEVDAPLTDWDKGWEATRDALKVSRIILALASIMRKSADATTRGKPWKRGAAELRFSFIFKRRPYPDEMVKAAAFVRAAHGYAVTE